MSDQQNAGIPIWAAPAIVTEIGEIEDGFDGVALKMYGKTSKFPVNLPSEARNIGAHLGRRVTVALLAAPAEGQSVEEQLVWHRGEVDRLRELLAAKPEGDSEARVEVGRATVVVTLRSADAEQAVAARVAAMMVSEATARQIAAAKRETDVANRERALLVRMMRSALLIIDAVVEAEGRGALKISATKGTRWDALRDFAADKSVRKWLLDNDDDKAFVEAVAAAREPDDAEPPSVQSPITDAAIAAAIAEAK